MRYFRSTARKHFVRDTRSAVAISDRIVQSRNLPSDARDFLLTAVVIHFNSKLETYLKDVIQSWCQRVSGRAFKMKNLPLTVRAMAVSHGVLPAEFKRHAFDGDERRLLRSIQKLLESRDVDLFNLNAIVVAVRHTTILKDRSFPSKENIEILLERVGIRHPFNRLSQISRADVAARLTSFQDVRNGLAHSGIEPGMNARDVIDKVKDVERIVAWIDRLLFNHFRGHTGRVAWV